MLKKLLIACGLLLLVAGVAFREQIHQVYVVATLFSEDRLVENFRNMYRLQPSVGIAPAAVAFEFERNPTTLPPSFVALGEEYDLPAFLEAKVTTGLIVIQADVIRHEAYFLGGDETSRFASHSMGKSFVSALTGIAIDEGFIGGVEDPVTTYLPELVGSGYEGVSLRDCLQMSTGIVFNEDYGDLRSDINQMALTIAMGTPLVEFIATLQRDRAPGEFNHYVSVNTEVVGMVVARATGRGLADYLGEKIWSEIGTESEAYWLLEPTGRELAMGGLSVTLRDYARFARLYLNQGNWNGRQIVPAAWVEASLRTDAEHLRPGPNPQSDSEFGYGYQWWVPEGDAGEFMALGIYGQMIYVNPLLDVIIVKTSADPHFQDDDFKVDLEFLEAFRTIAHRVAGPRGAG